MSPAPSVRIVVNAGFLFFFFSFFCSVSRCLLNELPIKLNSFSVQMLRIDAMCVVYNFKLHLQMQLFRWTKIMWHQKLSTTNRFETAFSQFKYRNTLILITHSVELEISLNRKRSPHSLVTYGPYFKNPTQIPCNEMKKINEEKFEIRHFNQNEMKGSI